MLGLISEDEKIIVPPHLAAAFFFCLVDEQRGARRGNADECEHINRRMINFGVHVQHTRESLLRKRLVDLYFSRGAAFHLNRCRDRSRARLDHGPVRLMYQLFSILKPRRENDEN